MNQNSQNIPPCMIFVSKEGKWYHEGAEIIHRPIFLWMIQSLDKTEEGLFIVHMNNQKCFLEVEDTPLVVTGVSFAAAVPEAAEQVLLTLNDDSEETLDPATLRISKESVLYCTVKQGKFPARFLRPAYYQIAEKISEDNQGGFSLEIGGRKFPIGTGR
ncbi:MAG: hypothetical protein AB1585_07665 [Thermodesulfobacteriota bacterium]